MVKDTYYFSHDYNARSDEKMLCLIAEHGMAGYGIFWILIESMFENGNLALQHHLLKGLAFNQKIDITLLQSVITTCLDVKLFVSDGESFWSESLRRRKSEWDDKREQNRINKSKAGKAGMAKRWGNKNKNNNSVITENNNVNNRITKVKESKVNNIKERDKEKNIDFLKFTEWIKTNAPNVLKMKEPFTEPQYLEIKKRLNTKQVTEILTAMHNYKPLLQKNISAYLTLLNWAKIRNENGQVKNELQPTPLNVN